MFKVGDCVKLKSGGPIMTIKLINGEKVGCEWFAKDELKAETFGTAQLEIVPCPDPSAGGVHFSF